MATAYNRRPPARSGSTAGRYIGREQPGYVPDMNTQQQPQPPPGYADIERHYSRKPMDRTLPDSIEEIIPEANLYKKLQEAEKKLDATITRKQMDLHDTLSRSIKKKKMLRVFVSNTCQDQPWQTVTGLEENAFDFDTGTIPSWNLKIEGRLVDDTPADAPGRPKFSSFFTSISVEFEHNEELEATEPNIVEWHEPVPPDGQAAAAAAPPQADVEFDVFDIRRKGDRPTKATITLQLKEHPNKFKLSQQLSDILAIKEATKPGVVVAMWQYIKFHKLQDVDEKRLIKCDGPLRNLFARDTISFPHIMELLNPHLAIREPIVIEYEVQVDRESNLGEVAYDIEIEVDDPIKIQMEDLLKNWFSNQQQIMELDDSIAVSVQSLNMLRLKREFFSQLAENPVEFLKKWLASQSRDLKLISADQGFSEENVRQSSFYTEDLLNQSIHLFLNSR